MNLYCDNLFFSCLDEAADIAFQQRDIQGLLYVQSKCGSQAAHAQLLERINAMITQLESRKWVTVAVGFFRYMYINYQILLYKVSYYVINY